MIAPVLFERLEERVADPLTLRAAAKAYTRESRDANELIEFAIRSQAARREAERDEYLDLGLAAARRSADALRDVVKSLPDRATTGMAAQAVRQQTESLKLLRR